MSSAISRSGVLTGRPSWLRRATGPDGRSFGSPCLALTVASHRGNSTDAQHPITSASRNLRGHGVRRERQRGVEYENAGTTGGGHGRHGAGRAVADRCESVGGDADPACRRAVARRRGVASVRGRGMGDAARRPACARLCRGGVPGQRHGERVRLGRRQQGDRADGGSAVHHAHAGPPADQRAQAEWHGGGGAAEPVQPVRPQHRVGLRARPVHAQRRRVDRLHVQADRRQGTQDIRPAALRGAVMGEPAEPGRPA